MLVLSILLMGVATVLVGLLPTYGTIGVLGPDPAGDPAVAAGVAVGGEWGGAVLLAVERAPRAARAVRQLSAARPATGLLLSTGVFALLRRHSQRGVPRLGMAGAVPVHIVLIGVGLWIRLKLEESTTFEATKRLGATRRVPILEVLRDYKKPVLLGLGSRLVLDVTFYVFTVFSLAYVTQELDLPKSVALTGVMIAAAIELFTIPYFGALSDRLGRKTVYMGGAVFLTAYAYPFFWLLDTGNSVLAALAIVLGVCIGHAATYGSQAALFAELFDTEVRYTGVSLTYQTSGIIGGGPAPFIALALLGLADGNPVYVIYYMLAVGLLSVVSTFFLEETYQRDFLQSRIRVASKELV